MQVVCGCSRCSGYLGYLAARVPTCVVMRLMSSMLLRLAVGQRLGLRARGRVLRRACGPWRQGHVCGGKGANRRNRPGHFHDVRPTAPTPASRGRGPGRVRSRGAEVRAVGGARRTGSGSGTSRDRDQLGGRARRRGASRTARSGRATDPMAEQASASEWAGQGWPEAIA